MYFYFFFFFQAEDGIRDIGVTGVQTCALPIFLRDNGIDNLKLYKWIEKEVNKKGVSFENLILTAHQKQSNYAISLGNSINSIRKVEALDWKAHFENLSKVHQVLNKDPSGEYLNMDFKSKIGRAHV